MDRKWIRVYQLSTEYEKGVEEFINFVVEHADNPNRINYPCIKCGCLDKVTVEVLRDHSFINEFDTSYTRWIWHSESAREDRPVNLSDKRCDENEEVECDEGDKLEDMMYDVDNTLWIIHTYSRAWRMMQKNLYMSVLNSLMLIKYF